MEWGKGVFRTKGHSVGLCHLFANLAVVTALLAIGAWGQMANTGEVSGQVSDPSGAVIPDATVKATDVSTGVTQTTTTNANGRYVLANVPPGTYNISVAKQGFTTTTVANQQIQVGVPVVKDLKLNVGAATQVVEVQATNAELQTENATVGNTVTGLALNSLPSLNRDVSTFVELQPGVTPDGSVAGAVVDQSSFQLDGGNNTNDMDGSMSVYTSSYAGDPTGGVANQSNAVAAGPTGVLPTPADSVEEFKVNSANQTADFNSSSGAQVQLVTRRGTNDWHGSIYEYYLDNNFSANTWDNNFNGTPLPNWHRSRFGARLGGPLIPKEILGGKTYFFLNYEGFRWPLTQTITRLVPSPGMEGLDPAHPGGVLTFDGTAYDLKAQDPLGIGISPAVAQVWQKYMPASNAACSTSRCDGVNTLQFRANVAVPQNSDFGVLRLDHDFGSKWHFMGSYRYFKMSHATTDQVDIGGLLPGDKLGLPSSKSSDPQLPWYFVAGLTTNISPYMTNDFHWSFLRNWWAWTRAGDVPQLPGLAGALEPFGESATQALIPYNVNTQQTRTRFWDGQDHMFRDDLSILRGTHLFKIGGMYQHNFNWHQRTDNGGGINYQPVYQLGTSAGAGIDMTSAAAGGLKFCASVSETKNCGRDVAAALGIVSISQQAYTRSGPNLALNPPLTPAFDQSTIPYYNVYFSDSWRMTPSFTLTYGLGWTLEMPPTEKNGKQVEFVDEANQVLSAESYLRTRQNAALQGQVYNPTVGFNLVGNTENGRKYPYDPFYGSFSPRIAAAWSPNFGGDSFAARMFGTNKTVVRGGYGRIFGRLNGVDLVLVPLLGTGLIQPVQCIGAASDGTCLGSSGANPSNAFRVGVNGLTAPLPAATPTLPQPLFPGINGIAAGAGEALDPHFRPNVVDSFDLTIQRQLSNKVSLEVGYIGRMIHHEYQPINVNTVPYMMTLGGQRFDQAYANVLLQYCGGIQGLGGGGCAANAAAVMPQPFFETALAGTGYCAGSPNCTQALVAAEGAAGTGNLTTQSVWSLWSDLDTGGEMPGFNFPRSMMNSPLPGTATCTGVTGPCAPCPGLTASSGPCGASGQLTSGVGVNASLGYGNYNAGFVSLKMSDWHGLTAQSNFTWSKDLTTQAVVQATSEDTAVDPFNLRRGYGYAGFDRKFVYNLFFVYPEPFFKGQKGITGRILGGWTFAPIFTAGTGLPMTLGTINGGGQAFGEGDSVNFFGNGNSENAIPIGPVPKTGVHYQAPGDPVSGTATSGLGVCNPPNFSPCYTLNVFANPVSVFNSIRQPILGLDNHDGGWGLIRGLPYWNMDFSIKKAVKITERVDVDAEAVFINIFNHVNFFDPGPGDFLDTSNPGSFGTIPGQGNTPRTMEFGLRVNF